jgi:hypothetical protein
MFEFFNFARKRRLTFDQLQTMQMVAQQVVLSLDGSVKIPGAAKKALALKFVGELLEQLGIVAPDSLIDVSIEAAVKLLRVLDTQTLPPDPSPEPGVGRRQPIELPSVSGRPPTSNSAKGLSL